MPVTLILYGVLALALVGGAFAIRSHIEGVGYQKAVAKLQPQIDVAKADAKMAVDANKGLQGDLKVLETERDDCKKNVEKIEAASKKATAAKNKAMADSAAKLQNIRQAIEAQKAALNEPAGETCEQIVSRMGARAVGIGAGQLRDHPPDGSGGDGKGPAPNQDSGSGTLRVR